MENNEMIQSLSVKRIQKKETRDNIYIIACVLARNVVWDSEMIYWATGVCFEMAANCLNGRKCCYVGGIVSDCKVTSIQLKEH